MPMIYDLTHALISLYPNSVWVMRGDSYDNLEWNDKNRAKPAKSTLDTEVKRLQQEYDAKEYQRKRSEAYPSIEEQLDLIYHNGIDAWKQKIQETKDKYPKGSI